MDRPTDAEKAQGLSPLHIATIRGETRRVRRMLKHDVWKQRVNGGDEGGTKPLMTAVVTGRRQIAQLLLQNGASTKAVDRRGFTALDYSRPTLCEQKLELYRKLGFPNVSLKQVKQRRHIVQLLRCGAALESWYDPLRLFSTCLHCSFGFECSVKIAKTTDSNQSPGRQASLFSVRFLQTRRNPSAPES